VLELQGHGGPVIVETLVERCIELGARRARPGDSPSAPSTTARSTSRRPKAVADLIDAGSRDAARAAMRSLQGEFSSMVQGLTDALIDLRTYVEAAIDFPKKRWIFSVMKSSTSA
jgi:tRNA modification GTPase